MPRQPRGVPSPLTVHVHPYPTRYHGGIWKRPVFGLPAVRRTYNTVRPSDMYPSAGLARSATNQYRVPRPELAGMGSLFDTDSGIFRDPQSDGGGLFNRAISGDDAVEKKPSGLPPAAYFAIGFVVVGGAVYFGIPLINKAMGK